MNPFIPTSMTLPSGGPPQPVNTASLPSLTPPPVVGTSMHAVLQPSSTPGPQASPRPTRRGRSNYTAMEKKGLLDIVQDLTPLGANHWAEVAEKYNQWAEELQFEPRDQNGLKTKFDKLVATKKKTGDPTCPDDVRRAKHIARDIMASAYAVSAGDDDCMVPPLPSDGEDEVRASNLEIDSVEGPSIRPVGARARKRVVGAGGIGKKRSKDPLVACVEQVAASMAEITSTIVGRQEESVEVIVQRQVAKAMAAQTEKLDAMQKILERLAEK